MTEDDWRWHMYDTVKGSDWLGITLFKVIYNYVFLKVIKMPYIICVEKRQELF